RSPARRREILRETPDLWFDGYPNPEPRSQRMRRASSTLRSSLLILIVVLLSGRSEAADGGGKLRLATCQFPVSAGVRANRPRVRTQMRRASDDGADLIHFPECALSGYAGVDLPSIQDLDWDALHRETEAILALARELGVWVVLGSTHRLSGDHKPHN